ncbi:MAG: hypothetical protein BMS9Abin02_1566 [Anaerolineae bacterium]|nr:MAG: hypothetical protein BMS9Abin02_1566 [Anaerolineae bacterium]
MKLGRTTRTFLLVTTILILIALVVSQRVAHSAGVGFGEYYILGTNADIMDALNDIPNSSASGSIISRLSIVSSSNGVNVYLDEAEDGYDFDRSDPYNTADAKWDIAAGGPGEQGDQLDRGEVLTLTETDTFVGGSTGVGGGDRLYVTGAPISVVRTVWPSNPGPYISGSWELYPVQRWQSSYTVPVGQDLDFSSESPAASLPFQYTFLFIEAEFDNTRVSVTDPINGVLYNDVLNQGENVLVKSVNSGTTVTGMEDGTALPRSIQAGLITSVNQVYDSRYYTLTPQLYLCNEYYISTPSMQFPLNEFSGRDINNSAYIYSFQDDTNVSIQTASGTTNVTLNSGDVYRFVMPQMPRGTTQGDYGARVATDDAFDKIWVLVAGDDDAPDVDWGHQALCVDYLSDDYYVPFAPYNPAHITPVNDNTIFYIDYDNDGSVDNTFSLDRFETKMLFDETDDILTGARIFASDIFQLAWGQDNTENTSGERTFFGTSNNDLDFGYTVLPSSWYDIILAIEKTAFPTWLPNSGGTVDYTAVVESGAQTVYNLDVIDLLPAGWAYVSDSAAITLSYGTGGDFNPSISGSLLTWDLSGLGLDDTMPPGAAITVTYQTQTTSGYAYGANINIVEAYGSDIPDDTNNGAAILRPNDTALVFITPLSVDKVSSAGGKVYRGESITYTMTIVNNGDIRQNNFVVNDPLPASTTYISGSVDGYTYTELEYRDNFDSGTAYNQSDGTADWAGQYWTEVGDNGSSGSGTIRIINSADQLLLENARGDYVYRTVPGDLTGKSVTLAVDYFETGTWESTDTFTVDVWDGFNWQTVLSHSDDFGDQGLKTQDISAFGNADTRVRFRSTATSTSEDVRIRYVQVIVQEPTAVTDQAINSPPDIIVEGDNYTLAPGQTMTITYQVNVDDPPTTGQTSVDNTVSVTSNQQLTPSEDSVSDELPTGTIGDFIWHDNNGDGVQDSGEPGISGVQVLLYEDVDGDGVVEPGGDDGGPVLTTTSDENGYYIFDGVHDIDYFVEFDLPTGYSFTTQDATSDDQDSDANPTTGLSSIVSISTNETYVDFDAGLISILDYGDLPARYNNTILADNGARHLRITFRMGDNISVEADGQESGTATADTFDDGVARTSDYWTNGAVVDIEVDLQGLTTSGLADVGIWIDWNNDGDFGDSSEFFAYSGLTVGSVNTIQITVPGAGTYTVGDSVFVRVRAFDPASIPGGTLDAADLVGLALNGEVEDYLWGFKPTAITLNSFQAIDRDNAWGWALAALLLSALTIWFAKFRYRRLEDA